MQHKFLYAVIALMLLICSYNKVKGQNKPVKPAKTYFGFVFARSWGSETKLGGIYAERIVLSVKRLRFGLKVFYNNPYYVGSGVFGSSYLSGYGYSGYTENMVTDKGLSLKQYTFHKPTKRKVAVYTGLEAGWLYAKYEGYRVKDAAYSHHWFGNAFVGWQWQIVGRSVFRLSLNAGVRPDFLDGGMEFTTGLQLGFGL
jgi:hypothetical protein